MADPRPNEVYDFGKSVIDNSREYRKHFEPIWDELYSNYRVQPLGRMHPLNDASQLGIAHANNLHYPSTVSYNGTIGGAVLKDQESHQIVESLLAQIILSCFSNRRYMHTEPIGREDATGSKLVTALIHHFLSLQGHYVTNYEWLKDGFALGTGILFLPWQNIVRDGHTIWDDPQMMPVSLYDFYPDPSASRIEDMSVVGRRFTMTAHEAMTLANNGVFEPDMVRKAIDRADNIEWSRDDEDRLRVDDMTASDLSLPERWKVIEGWELHTVDTPWKPSDGQRARVITLFRDVPEGPARNEPTPFADKELPYIAARINPIGGRFYGLSPIEVNRFSQDFTDLLLMARADAVQREVRGAWKALDGFVDDPQKLLTGLTNQIHMVNDMNAIEGLEFNHSLQNAYVEGISHKNNMRQAAGAPDPVQGISSAGSQTATEIATVAQRAMSRLEVHCALLENDCFPRIAALAHSRYVQFLENDEELRERIGETPLKGGLDDIRGRFNFRFVGSRQTLNKAQRAANLREAITVLGSIPFVASQVDWNQLIVKYLEDGLEIRDFEDFMADAGTIVDNVGLQRVLGGGSGQGSIAAPQGRPQDEGRRSSDVGGLLQ